MSSPNRTPTRRDERFRGYSDLTIIYEGRSRAVPVRVPDISAGGMFINTADHLPEGTVLNLRFVLNRTKFEVCVRSEVRYCLPGVGVGIEFLDITPEAQRAIQEEFS
jgi:c-di-GMP-binding flagellar brake protein YcgR